MPMRSSEQRMRIYPSPPVLQLVQDGDPVFGAFILSDLYAQDFLFTFQRKAKDDTGSKLADHPVLPHGIMDCVDVDHEIDFLIGRFFQSSIYGSIFRHVRDKP